MVVLNSHQNLTMGGLVIVTCACYMRSVATAGRSFDIYTYMLGYFVWNITASLISQLVVD